MNPLRKLFSKPVFRVAWGCLLFAGSPLIFLKSTHAGASPEAERQEYTAKVNESYDYRFGAGKPFLPSNATTEDGQPVNSCYPFRIRFDLRN